MLYTAYGKECRLTFNKIFDGQWGLRSEYKKDELWVYIDEPTIWTDVLTTKELTDAAYIVALDAINIATELLFGSEPTEPQYGPDRIQWLVDNQTVVVDNNLALA